MRCRRLLKRVMLALLFVCMTLKIHLEMRMLDSTKTGVSFSPWWSSQTPAHPRLLVGHSSDSPQNLSIKSSTLNISSSFIVDYIVNNRTNSSKNIELNMVSASNQIRNFSAKSEVISKLSKQEETPVHSESNNTHIGSNTTQKHNLSTVDETQSEDMKHNLTSTHQEAAHTITVVKKHIFAKLGIWDSHNKIKIHNVSTDFTEIKLKPVNQTLPENSKENTPPVAKENPPTRAKEDQQVLPIKLFPPVNTVAKPEPPKRGVSHVVDSTEVSLTKEDIIKIKKLLAKENEEQKVYNQDRFGPIASNTTILLVQVHNRLENLRHLVRSLQQTRDIQEALVIFSHDFWNPVINAFIRNVTNFRVMQIFFPFSIQLHPLTFPGRDPRDCAWNVERREELQCLNRVWPDSYGHYREASFTQIKHHWWWKIHRVFDGLNVTRSNYTGHVIFLEEDHYVFPDLLHVLRLLRGLRASACPSCQVLALGNYNKMAATAYKNSIEKGDWWVTKHNLGFALDRAAWTTLAQCKEFFCDFDDYNWDWTLYNLVQTCLHPRMTMLSARLSRVMHVGSCGTHVKKRTCDVHREVRNAETRLRVAKEFLFPPVLVLQDGFRSSGKPKRGNGGWGDLRDRQLCRAIGNYTASDHTLASLLYPPLPH
ncbi:alpha-1,6-mannosyl-glycoprotein 2-beta-N-acetylglucosaminyltransferase [Procambarus clarkii]|uniref:alpha-1,6-mannosyl-glycoprotein 2-beta-N-acetylglucosaminyltransferase n=1 Tax=Procambarus clarkii TaxID=6728 RepID=UPI001E67847B|nr:alpha-1,6-mannosyl-glycoprotein 2-beta-N-acetylglucosaminyltransferase-like [Procambarus clarkii]